MAVGLVFRCIEQEYAHNRNEINAFAAELVFREVPGELVQGRRDTERFRLWWGLGVALIDSVGCAVAGVSRSPVGLGFLTPGGLTGGVTAGPLAISYSRIRIEPSQADPTGAFPGSGHAP